jgi:hypothetical protein
MEEGARRHGTLKAAALPLDSDDGGRQEAMGSGGGGCGSLEEEWVGVGGGGRSDGVVALLLRHDGGKGEGGEGGHIATEGMWGPGPDRRAAPRPATAWPWWDQAGGARVHDRHRNRGGGGR